MKILRLTFNKPTIDHFFAGDEAKAVRVKIEDGAAYFLPVAEATPETLPVEYRTRGGAEATVEGKMLRELARALQNPVGPFFTLQRVKGGWLKAVQFTKVDQETGEVKAPQKFDPHIRVWVPKDEPAVRTTTDVAVAASFGDYLGMVRQAQTLVAKYERRPQSGTEPADVAEARENLDEFRKLADVVNADRLDLLQQAQDLIARAIGAVSVTDTGGETERPAIAHRPDNPAPQPAPQPAPKAAPLAARDTSVVHLRPKKDNPTPAQSSFGAKEEITDEQVAAVAARLGAPRPKNPREKAVVVRDERGRPHRRHQHA